MTFSIDTSGVDPQAPFLSQEIEEIIYRRLGQSEGTAKFIEVVNDSGSHTFLSQFQWQEEGRPGENVIRDEVKKIRDLAAKLAGALENIRSYSEQLIFCQGNLPRNFSFHTISRDLKTLRTASGNAAAFLGPKNSKPGPVTDRYLAHFIDELVEAYWRSFGRWPSHSKNASKGHNFHFLVAELLHKLGMVDKQKNPESTDREDQIEASILRVKAEFAD